MLWHYEPLDPARVFLPGLDAHDGHLPKLGTTVQLDHAVALGVDSPSTDPMLRSAFVRRPSTVPTKLAPLFPERVAGRASMTQHLANGDWYLPASPTHASLTAALHRRLPPPGA